MSTRGFVLIAALWPVATVAQRSQPVGADSLASMDLGVTIECYFPPQPELVGAMDALMESIHYPPEAIEAGVEGRVFVQVVVDEDGRASQIEIARSPDFRLMMRHCVSPPSPDSDGQMVWNGKNATRAGAYRSPSEFLRMIKR